MVTESLVTVLENRYVPGFGRDDAGPAYKLPLSKALPRTYSTDAHFTQCVSPVAHRLTAEAIGKVEIKMEVIAFDFDAPTHGTDEPVSEQWREDLHEKVLLLFEEHGQGFAHDTKNGARALFTMAPTFIATAEDAAQWKREYSVLCAYLNRRYGLHADPACDDWSRLFRLPHATREPGGKPEQRATIGDPSNVARLWIDKPTRADVARAKLAKPQVWSRRRERDTFAFTGGGAGVLFYALQARGHIVRELKHGHQVVCPNDAVHSCGKSGDSSCMLYPPSPGDAIGWLHCLHASCSGRTAKEWLALFSESELEAARRAAGVRVA